jgi:hypothetical protein
MLPFVPESKVWKDKKLAGTLKRPSFAGLFSSELRRVTILFKDEKVESITADPLPVRDDTSDPALPGYRAPGKTAR